MTQAHLEGNRNKVTEVNRVGVSGFHLLQAFLFWLRTAVGDITDGRFCPQAARPPCGYLVTVQQPGDVWRIMSAGRVTDTGTEAPRHRGSFFSKAEVEQVCGGIQRGGATVVASYLRTFPLFLPPPQPPLHITGLSRKEMRSLPTGADVACLGDGRFSPE